MNKILLICLLTLNLPVFSQTSTNVTEVTYKLNFNLNTIDDKLKDNYNSEQLAFLKNRYKNYNSLNYKLLYNNNESLFFLTDSILGVSRQFDKVNKELQGIIKTERNKKYYRNISNKELLYTTRISGEPFLITFNTDSLEWKLTNKHMKIGNYDCFQAILVKGNYLLAFDEKLIISVWYAPSIPVPFGPLFFGGLPGLVMQLELGPKTYYVDHIKFNQQHKIEPLKNGKPMTMKQYSDFLHNFFGEDFGK